MKGIVLCLCDLTGNFADPWVEFGYTAPPSEDRANFRSITPRGFARAVFLANAPELKNGTQL